MTTQIDNFSFSNFLNRIIYNRRNEILRGSRTITLNYRLPILEEFLKSQPGMYHSPKASHIVLSKKYAFIFTLNNLGYVQIHFMNKQDYLNLISQDS